MNESKSSRYHRLRRRAALGRGVSTLAVLLAAIWLQPRLPLWAYALALAAVVELTALPFALYRGVLLERRYELSTEPLRGWLADEAKGFLVSALIAVLAAEGVYAAIRWDPIIWWIPASIGAAVLMLAAGWLAPVLLLPRFYRVTPLDRPTLADRLTALSKKAGVSVLGVYEWGLGAKTRRANAALAGAVGTRRILLSDTLLSEYSDDEIEVILAHELAHHVHRDIPKTMALESVRIAASLYVASVVLNQLWQPLGLGGTADPAGLPLVALSAGAVMLISSPLAHALSRRQERLADRYALNVTRRQAAFVSAMRRLATQNLSEESPSRLAVLLFHTHPPVEERIKANCEL